MSQNNMLNHPDASIKLSSKRPSNDAIEAACPELSRRIEGSLPSTMQISIITVFPALYEPFVHTSLIGRAQEKGMVSIHLESFFSYVAPKERIDAPSFGHGAGMLIRPDVVEKAITDKEERFGKALKIFFSPHGRKLNQHDLEALTARAQQAGHLMLVAGRYEGMDARVEEVYADEIISVGDFVLMGGDVPAMVLLEGMLRLIPGVVGKQESVEQESFSGPFVDYPEYTAPVMWQGFEVPAVVRSGNHAQLRSWRTEQAAKRTIAGHMDWVKKQLLDDHQKEVVHTAIPSHYMVLTHTDVLVGKETKIPGTTSVTSLDMHDIARSCATYGIKNYFIVTPLIDQQRVVNVLLDFWQKGAGLDYNKNRHQAVKAVRLESSIADVIDAIEKIEGKRPLIIATSARDTQHAGQISFYDHAKVWASGRPILFVFGTGQGLTPEFIAGCDFLLPPLEGLTKFRHLSVRSAVAVVLDRWLGLSPQVKEVGNGSLSEKPF
jgi:tRNA (guanine37-N1)-methyltransferase